MNTLPSRPRRRLLTGLLLGGGLALAAPMAASAHIHVTPDAAAAGAASSLTFSFSHGCEQSPTTALVVTIPDGVTNVLPLADAAWTVDRDVTETGRTTSVTYTAVTPIDTGLKGQVGMDVRFAEELAGEEVAFPVVQQCAEGEAAWTEVAEPGAEEPEFPAAVVAVGEPTASSDEHGSHGSHGEDGAHAADGQDAAGAAAPAETEPASAAALWLGGAGLGAGVLALVVAVFALRRRR
ncbi:DUF1775 domain-containing protein [Microbacterium caowuchunii]|uniref:DUF1775 domain-containing protein n=1 Tax=Microbacterium caowuchunii TaxID=2614638 RepID=UPI00124748A2|nr:DUF1775 domain-containing protein [Microbacterium caowuchunii]QEW01195.1 DUF1775 domain-containing protein [Microbacterium caowuchunii]